MGFSSDVLSFSFEILAFSWASALRALAGGASGLKLAQVGSKLVQVEPKISSGSLQEALLERPGRVLGGSWEALGAKRPSWRPQRCQNGLQVTPKSTKSIKLILDLRALASERSK